MSSLGLDSPMFDYIEQISGRSTATGTTPGGKVDKRQKEKQAIEREVKKLKDTNEFEQADQMEFADNEDDTTLARMKVDPEEYEIIKSSLQILEDIQLSA